MGLQPVQVIKQEILHAIDQIHSSSPVGKVPILVATSRAARVLASQLVTSQPRTPLSIFPFKDFKRLTESIAGLSTDELVRRFQVTYPEAEALIPGLMAYAQLGKVFAVQEVWIPQAGLRDGLLREMTSPELWTEELGQQVIRSAITLGEKYHYDAAHGKQVAHLCGILFAELQDEHVLSRHDALLLQVAALLHDIGLVISNRSHHKHSYYLLSNSDLFGLSRRDMQYLALVARYHRRASPSLTHPEFAELDRGSRMTISKMTAILRVADALDRNHLQQFKEINCSRSGGQFGITIWGLEDLSLERFALQQKGSLFEEVYGMPVVLHQGRARR
jgi:exopolyphosphatase/guanosine-5'-triphosphate,3'-diphosphate pyrophosphatase